MPYELQLAQINTSLGGLAKANTAWGFPANTDFSTLLMSYWACGPVHTAPGTSGAAGIWPQFMSAEFFGFDPGLSAGIKLTNTTLGSSGSFFDATWTSPFAAGTLSHFLLSVDTHAQVVQLYVNDQNVPLTGAAWTGTPPFNFRIISSPNIWDWNVSGVISSNKHPALGDVWITNPPAFVDLSIAANRRKFINVDLTPVDLGNAGTAPFGYQPALYMSVRPGGVPGDILLNRGVGGGTWGYSQDPPTFQAPGSCVLPPPPPPPPLTLSLDDLLVTAARPIPPGCLISLEWSDDRGHSFGNPVTQPMGATGQYKKSLAWHRLGYARDRVWRLTWSCPSATALQGAWIEVAPEK